jgi:hypothetical protein
MLCMCIYLCACLFWLQSMQCPVRHALCMHAKTKQIIYCDLHTRCIDQTVPNMSALHTRFIQASAAAPYVDHS